MGNPEDFTLSLWVKGEIFTYGTVSGTPHPRLGFSNIRKMVAYCKNKGSQGYPRMQYSIWKHIACNKLQLSDDVAWVYFEQYHLIANEFTAAERLEMFHLTGKSEIRQHITANTLQFVLFLYIQQLHKIFLKSSLVTGDEWPSRTRSPDLENTRGATSGKNLDENSHFTFVMHHMNDIMELMIDPSVADEHSELHLNLEAVKALGFLIGASIDGDRNITPLHEVAVMREVSRSTGYTEELQVFTFKKLHSWLRGHLAQSPFGISSCIGHGKRLSWLPTETTGTSKRGKIGTNGHLVNREIVKGNKVIIMTQIGKQMVARSSGTLENANVKIHRCQWSYFYLLSPLRSVSIEKCKNCTIVLGPVEVAIIVSGCENVQVIAPCARFVISNSTLCTLNLLTPTRPLILPGNDGIIFGPYNTFYPKIEEHMKKLVVPASINLWDQPLITGHEQHHVDHHSSPLWDLMPPGEFQKFVIPFEMEGKTSGIPHPLPSAYKRALDEKKRNYKEWQRSVSETEMTPENQKSFQSLVEQRFQDWLAEVGHKKEIDAIVQHLEGGKHRRGDSRK